MVLLYNNFTPLIALIITLFVLFKITYFFLKHQVLLPYNIADLTQFL